MAEKPPPPIDDYERSYMGGDAPLARSRIANPWWFHALFAPPIVALIFAAVTTPQALVPLLLLPLMLLLWICIWFLRLTVTPTHVHVQYGLFGPKIPVSAIQRASAETYEWTDYGGWGIRYRPGIGWAYSVPGGGGRGVKIAYGEGARTKEVFVSTDRPDEIVAAIERARTGVRVASESASARGPRVVEEELAEDEDEAKGSRSARRR
jgi:hypothetical protein